MSKSVERIVIRFPAQSDYVGVARLAVSGVASRMNFTIEQIEDIKIAVSEACTNAVQYAYDEPGEDDVVELVCSVYPDDKLEITIQDFGKGFDISAAKQRNDEKANRAGGTPQEEGKVPSLGLGMTFVRSLMDEADFNSETGKGTTVHMVKAL